MFLSPLVREPGRGWQLENADTGMLLARPVESAFDSAARRRGLLGRSGLDGGALVIAPCHLVHTCFMRFAIDTIFVDREGRVVGVRHDVAPWRVAGSWRGFATIEVDAGQARRAGIRPGHRLALEPSVGVLRCGTGRWPFRPAFACDGVVPHAGTFKRPRSDVGKHVR